MIGELLVWDTDAIINAMKNPAGRVRFSADFLARKLRVTAATVLELAVWSSSDKKVEGFYKQLGKDKRSILVPKAKEFYRAGRWLQSVKIAPGTPEERKARRTALTMDSITAATAWSRGLRVVTMNARDFATLEKAATGQLGTGQKVPGHLKPYALP